MTCADLWDTAGQDCFSSMHPSYYYKAHACIMVFDVTRKITYKHLQKWWDELQIHQPGIPTILVANKIDIDKEVTNKKFAFAEKNNLPFFFVSASDGTNVVRVSSMLLRTDRSITTILTLWLVLQRAQATCDQPRHRKMRQLT